MDNPAIRPFVGRSTNLVGRGEMARVRPKETFGTLSIPALGLIWKMKGSGLSASVLVLKGTG